MSRAARIATLIAALCLGLLSAQERGKPATTVPRLFRLSGSFHQANGLAVGSTESATLSIYREEQGGTPLWQETQNVALDADGHYTAMLGLTQRDGVPVDLFSATEPRWLGIQFNRPGEIEQPRVQMVSVPYALKASDAETLGGRPASAYLLDPNAVATESANASGSTTPASAPNAKSLKPRAIAGTMNYLPYFTDNSNDLGNSVLYQSGGNIGLGTQNPSPLNASAIQPKLVLTGTGVAQGIQVVRTVSPGVAGAQAILSSTRGGDANSYTALQNGDGIGIFSFNGTDGTQFVPAAGVYAQVDGAVSTNNVPGRILFTTSAGGANNLVERMRITSGGNVGIGTSTPGSALDVAGNINTSGSFLYQGSSLLQVPGGVNGNLALGLSALSSNTTGSGNTAIGNYTLYFNTIGTYNTANASGALFANTTGNYNTAMGISALRFNTTGGYNTAIGGSALVSNTSGDTNTAVGYYTLAQNTTGFDNIAIGYEAAFYVAGSNSFNIHIGSQGRPSDNGTIRIGVPDNQTSFFAAGIRGVTTGSNDAVPVMIDSAGQLGTVSSSRRFKEDIQDMGDASSGLLKLRPVTFRYKKPFGDGSKPIQYGLIAEEVAEVYPDLVAHSSDGQIETVKYQVLDSMLLNEVQRLNRENQQLQERLARLESAMQKMMTAPAEQ